MKTLNLADFVERISYRHGAQMVTIVAKTNPALAGGKKCPLYGRNVEKLASVQGMINWSYETAVNNRRSKEAFASGKEFETFESKPRAWGRRVYDGVKMTPYVIHTPKDTDEKRVYLEYRFLKSIHHQYMIDGKIVDNSEVEPYLRPVYKSKTQNVEEDVILRDYQLSNLEFITFGGEQYKLEITVDQEPVLYDQLDKLSRIAA
jgi:hypothetical protein